MRLTKAITRNAQTQPNNISTQNGKRRRTFRETRDRIARYATGLIGLGVKPGERVAVLALNSDYYYETFFAVPWMGAVLVPLNIRWNVKENIYALEDSGSHFLAVDDAFLASAKDIASQSSHEVTLIYIGENETPEGTIGINELTAPLVPPADEYEADDDTLAGIFYTGGTTGFPKGVMISHKAIWTSSITASMSLEIQQTSRYLHAAPMFHMADIAISMASTMTGASHVFIPAFSPEGVVKAVEANNITVTLLVPTMISMMLADPALDNGDLSSLKKIVYGASPITEATLRLAMEKMGHVDFFQAYGQSEMAPLISIMRPEDHDPDGDNPHRLRSAGQAVICADIKIADEDGNTLATGQIGEIVARGPNKMLGYWNKPEETAKALKDGWVYTGDAGYLDDDGYLYLVDRVKDMIITGGENVFSVEVENAVARHDAVHEVVVIGVPCEQWGEKVHAIVRLMPDAQIDEDELIEHCRDWIAGYKCPRSVEFQEDPFPTTGAGKIRKVDIREKYWETEEA
ncbi:long-chain-fatty-acid--CoA ligase [Sansalvadorimonas sp. 2012CJ34-2]|uniref:Long-chain-fatty-acid--CoA ligase n=1 Tax=Parendozoicomonas callyspongiae TaxID=2942213 RepID=A0ABT0PKM5_9GAMM|nr:long-chain-fatty-acid--CoA ligase [Sansalvadorimonas sp. 2012CJ34-2]MCL6271003.1 long-chain-fatty-acid--CoA ligase [Sansalvadorimonas sp. 2012CJ34-2]